LKHTYYRGNIYYADLNPVVGSEQSGIRPVLLIQNNRGNKHSQTLIIAPITSKVYVKAKLPTHVYLPDFFDLPAIILLEQIRTIDKTRIREFVGRLDSDIMQSVNRCMEISLGMNNNSLPP